MKDFFEDYVLEVLIILAMIILYVGGALAIVAGTVGTIAAIVTFPTAIIPMLILIGVGVIAIAGAIKIYEEAL